MSHIITLTIFVSCIVFVVWLIYSNPFRDRYIDSQIQQSQQQKIEQFKNKIQKLSEPPPPQQPPQSPQQSQSPQLHQPPQINVSHKTQNKTQNLNIQMIKKHISLFWLYHNGIPDRYDTKGNKIKGLEPQPQLAIQHIRLGIRHGWGRWGLLELAKMLHFGIHNFTPDLYKARDLYRYIIKTTKDKELLDLCKELYYTIDFDIKQQQAIEWLGISSPNTENVASTTTQPQPQQPQQPLPPLPLPPLQNVTNELQQTQPIDVTTIIHETNHQDGINIDGNINSNDAQTRKPFKIKNDKQNVHDSTLLSTIRQSISKLQEAVPTHKLIPINQVLQEIKDLIKQQPDSNKRTDAFKALDAIEKNIIPISSIQLKTIDILQLVWSRICSRDDDETKQQLKESLYNQLADCIEYNKPVCTTGIFTRIIDSLNVLDELVTIKPTFAIQQEMMNKCSQIREELYKTMSEQDRSVIDNDINQQNTITIEFDKKLKEYIKEQLKKDYVDRNIWTQEKLNIELQKWIDFI